MILELPDGQNTQKARYVGYFDRQIQSHRRSHRIGKEQKAHSFDLFDDAAATRRNAGAPTAAMLLARSSQPE